MLTHHTADEALRCPVTLLQDRNGPAACVPGSEVSLGEILEHGPLQLGLCQKLPLLRRSPWPEPRVLLLQLSQPRGFLSLHPTELLPPAVVGWLRLFDDLAGLIDGLLLTINGSAVLSVRMICSAMCLVRFMVESPAQAGRIRTLMHPGPIARVHVTNRNYNILPKEL